MINEELIKEKQEEYKQLMNQLKSIDVKINELTSQRSNLSVQVIKLDGWLECAKLRE